MKSSSQEMVHMPGYFFTNQVSSAKERTLDDLILSKVMDNSLSLNLDSYGGFEPIQNQWVFLANIHCLLEQDLDCLLSDDQFSLEVQNDFHSGEMNSKLDFIILNK